jgi:hypothetical protein
MSTQQREVLKTQPQGKTGYDIRSDILMMAKDLAIKEFDSEFEYWKILNRGMENKPEFPSIDKVLEIANRMNDFVGKK